MAVKTIAEIQDDYNTALIAENTEINPYVIGTDWDIKGLALAAVMSALYQDVNSVSNNIYVINASGYGLDLSAYSFGLVPRFAVSFATADVNTQTPYLASDITFPADTLFLSNFNGYNYSLVIDTSISSTVVTALNLRATIPGLGQQLPVGSTLTATYAGVTVTAIVTVSTDGQGSETDSQMRLRVSTTIQNPVGAAREGQYREWALQTPIQSTDAIQDAIVIPEWDATVVIGIFGLAPGTDYDNILINGLSFTRTLLPADVLTLNAFLNYKKPIGVTLLVGSVATFIFEAPNQLTVDVVLIPGLTLASIVPNIDGAGISVEDFILQEIRRGFITYPYQGSQIDNTTDRYILISRLEQTLDAGLSVNGGIYAQIIVDRVILYNATPGDNIPVPYQTLNVDNNLEAIYDSLGADVVVGLL